VLHLDEELRVGEPHAVARGGTVHLGVLAAGEFKGHGIKEE
jgi:hypothetical protein